MNGIGITEWRDIAVSSSYPLERDYELNSLFVDASFVQFDGFVPVLKGLDVQADGVVFTFLLDDGTYTTKLTGDNCVDGYVMTLRNPTRCYGRIVCGPGIVSLYANSKGASLTPNVRFLSVVVRSLPSTAGLFSLQGISGGVTVATDQNQRLDVASNRVVWNTVARPSHADQFTLSASKLYAITSTKQFVEIDPVSHSLRVLFALPKAYKSIAVSDNHLLAADGNKIVSLNDLPPTDFMDIGVQINAIAPCGDGLAVLCADDKIRIYDIGPHELATTFDLPSPAGQALFSTDTICDPNYSYTYASPGSYDRTAGKNISDLICNVDVGTLGMLTLNGNIYQPTIYGFAPLNGVVYAILSNATASYLITMDTLTYTATVLATYNYDPAIGQLVSLTAGGTSVTLRKVTPLKTINDVAPVDNAIQLLGSNLIQINQTGTDELTVDLAVDLADTTISRSSQYQ